MTSRETILSNIRQSIKGSDVDRLDSARQRLRQKKTNTLPHIAQLRGDERTDWFIQQAEAKGGRVLQVETINEMPPLIDGWLEAGYSFTSDITELLTDMPISKPRGANKNANCISACYCAIAESGSIVITSDSPGSVNQIFLADRHLVVLFVDQIVDCMESVWRSLEEEGTYPRHMTLVSGPSSTGDIELEMENGVHGPKELHIILVANRGAQ